ncbi:PH domain-containing protein (plasmid) [Paraburkholderia sp. DD10]|uniref:PH domain-containing protein n=1 Tax=Paraburkholderia sp. DD10 TaxID=3409691 RepID=UPI003B9DF72F
MARYGTIARAEIAREVIFSGTPSQVVNLPTFIRWLVVAALIIAGYVFALTRWPVPWFTPALALLLVGLGVLLAYLQTAFTEIIIDTERITCRQGILNRRVSSIELFRIQDVTSVHPWWQRLFGIGAAVVMTSDSNNPVWLMPGMQHAEQLRDELNRAAIALRDVKGVREVNMGRV